MRGQRRRSEAMDTAPSHSTIPGLLASGPDPGGREDLMMFGRFVGGWSIEASWYKPDGGVVHGTGEVHFGWILDGRAVQDVWLTRRGDPARLVPSGTTIRWPDASTGGWRCVWIAPQGPLLQTFIARAQGDRIVLEGATPDGRPERWIYSEVTPTSFHWHSEESHDGGKSWVLTEEMRATRIAAHLGTTLGG